MRLHDPLGVHPIKARVTKIRVSAPSPYLRNARLFIMSQRTLYNVQMDAAGLGDRLPDGAQKSFLGPGRPSLQCRHWETSNVLVGLAFFEMLSQYPRSAFQGHCGGHQRGSAAVCDPNPPRPFARSREPRSKFYAKSPPERVPGDKFISLPWGMWWSFWKLRGWQILSQIFLGKTEIKFATKNPPGFSRRWGGVKIQNFIT